MKRIISIVFVVLTLIPNFSNAGVKITYEKFQYDFSNLSPVHCPIIFGIMFVLLLLSFVVVYNTKSRKFLLRHGSRLILAIGIAFSVIIILYYNILLEYPIALEVCVSTIIYSIITLLIYFVINDFYNKRLVVHIEVNRIVDIAMESFQ